MKKLICFVAIAWFMSAALSTDASQPAFPRSDTSMKMESDGMELDIDRLGLDYQSFDLPASDPRLCRNACADDLKCKAWTYVKPNTVQGPRPRCWLKYAVPSPVQNSCCVSGVKQTKISPKNTHIDKSATTEKNATHPENLNTPDDLGEL